VKPAAARTPGRASARLRRSNRRRGRGGWRCERAVADLLGELGLVVSAGLIELRLDQIEGAVGVGAVEEGVAEVGAVKNGVAEKDRGEVGPA
jgi:hypothetical protein